MVKLTNLYNPDNGAPNVALFISGSGTNAEKILEHSHTMEREIGAIPYNPVVIFTDKRKSSRASEIADQFGINKELAPESLRRFCKARGTSWLGSESEQHREEYDARTVEMLEPYNIDIAAFAGYMLRATPTLLESYIAVNVHPGDLRLADSNRKRILTGDNAVAKALRLGHSEIRSSTHLMTAGVDEGPLLMVSDPINIKLPQYWDSEDNDLVERVADEHQERLKVIGDWQIFPRTLELIAYGRFAQNHNEDLFFDGYRIPQGITLDEAG